MIPSFDTVVRMLIRKGTHVYIYCAEMWKQWYTLPGGVTNQHTAEPSYYRFWSSDVFHYCKLWPVPSYPGWIHDCDYTCVYWRYREWDEEVYSSCCVCLGMMQWMVYDMLCVGLPRRDGEWSEANVVLGKRVWGVREEFVGCGEGLVKWGMWFSPLSGSVNDAVIYKGRKWIALSCYSQVCLSLSAVFATVSTP